MKNEENGLSYDASYSAQRVFRATGNEFGSIFHLLIKHVRKEREMTEKLTNTHKLESSKNLLLICSLIIFFLHISLLSYFNYTYLRSCVFFEDDSPDPSKDITLQLVSYFDCISNTCEGRGSTRS